MVQMRENLTIGEKITDNRTKAGTNVYKWNEILTYTRHCQSTIYSLTIIGLKVLVEITHTAHRS